MKLINLKTKEEKQKALETMKTVKDALTIGFYLNDRSVDDIQNDIKRAGRANIDFITAQGTTQISVSDISATLETYDLYADIVDGDLWIVEKNKALLA